MILFLLIILIIFRFFKIKKIKLKKTKDPIKPSSVNNSKYKLVDELSKDIFLVKLSNLFISHFVL